MGILWIHMFCCLFCLLGLGFSHHLYVCKSMWHLCLRINFLWSTENEFIVLLSFWIWPVDKENFLFQGYCNFLPEERLLEAVEVGQVGFVLMCFFISCKMIYAF